MILQIYVDESGDLGFTKNATKYFIVAYVSCEKPIRIQTELSRLLKRFHQSNKYAGNRNELKFSRMDDSCRKKVLETIIECEVSLGAVVMEKRLVKSNLRDSPPVLYNWCVVHNIMLSLLPQITAENKIQITFDKSLPMWRINEFNSYVRNKVSYLLYEKGNNLPPNCIALNHMLSEKEFGLQAADAVAGAYFQKYEKNNSDYVQIIEQKVDFFKYL